MATKRRLKTMTDLRRYFTHTTLLLDKDKLDTIKAGKIGYLCNITEDQ